MSGLDKGSLLSSRGEGTREGCVSCCAPHSRPGSSVPSQLLDLKASASVLCRVLSRRKVHICMELKTQIPVFVMSTECGLGGHMLPLTILCGRIIPVHDF